MTPSRPRPDRRGAGEEKVQGRHGGTTQAHSLRLEELELAACDRNPVTGLTHRHYRYPARFSPLFARACIEAFSRPGDIVYDPYMGGGTTPLEAMVLGRRAFGSDLNSLAVFIARVKLAVLTAGAQRAVHHWEGRTVPCRRALDRATDLPGRQPRNMSMPTVRWLRKTISQCLAAAET